MPEHGEGPARRTEGSGMTGSVSMKTHWDKGREGRRIGPFVAMLGLALATYACYPGTITDISQMTS